MSPVEVKQACFVLSTICLALTGLKQNHFRIPRALPHCHLVKDSVLIGLRDLSSKLMQGEDDKEPCRGDGCAAGASPVL
jgi:hypothetical protein